MKEQLFDAPLTLRQLKCFGILEVLELMELGYPSRTSHVKLYSIYKNYIPMELQELEPKQFLEVSIFLLFLSNVCAYLQKIRQLRVNENKETLTLNNSLIN